MAPTPAAAAEVLQGIGYWPAHVQLSLLTSGITEAFRPDLEVGSLLFALVVPFLQVAVDAVCSTGSSSHSMNP